MSLSVAAAVLMAALLHATWNAIVRFNEDRLGVVTLLAGSAALIALPGLFLVAPPAAPAWPWLAASVALHLGYNVFLANAYRHGDLGGVYPVARGAAPVITLIATGAFLDEPLDPIAAAGVLVVGAGIVALAFENGMRALIARPHGVALALTTSLFIAGYSVVDGVGARLAGSAHSYVIWLFVLNGVPLIAYALATRGSALKRMFLDNWAAGLVGGALSLAAYWIVIWAMTRAPIALVAALRETSVVFAVAIGIVFLGERITRNRIVAIATVMIGLVMLRL